MNPKWHKMDIENKKAKRKAFWRKAFSWLDNFIVDMTQNNYVFVTFMGLMFLVLIIVMYYLFGG